MALAERFVSDAASGGDGLDPLGLALSNATYDHTGNGEGERHLLSTGDFSGYTFVSGDRIYLLNAVGGVADGLYEVASRVDDDAILLVADAGLTADSTTDVDSSPGPWTITESVTNAAAGQRVNVKSDGTYTLAADLSLPLGTDENPLEYRGYNAALGDLETVGRASATAALTITNFPVIDGGTLYKMDLGGYSITKNIRFITGLDAPTVTFAAREGMWRCSVHNSHATGASAQALVASGATRTTHMDCDFSIAGTNASADAVKLSGRDNILRCRIWHTGSPNSSQNGVQSSGTGISIVGCVIFNCGRGIETSDGTQISHNTIFDCVDGVYLGSNISSYIANNIIYNMSAYAIGGTNSGSTILLSNAMGSHTSGRINTSGLGSVMEEIDAILLTADPFTNGASEDFSLNTTSGGGALCRATSLFWAGEGDIGAVQHADAGGGSGGILVHPGTSGGARG